MDTVVYTVAFHGGTDVVEKPEIRISPRNLDEAGVYTRDEALRRLKTERLFNQMTFKTAKALAFCRFVSSESIGGSGDE